MSHFSTSGGISHVIPHKFQKKCGISDDVAKTESPQAVVPDKDRKT